jgi:hypothetical protein
MNTDFFPLSSGQHFPPLRVTLRTATSWHFHSGSSSIYRSSLCFSLRSRFAVGTKEVWSVGRVENKPAGFNPTTHVHSFPDPTVASVTMHLDPMFHFSRVTG